MILSKTKQVLSWGVVFLVVVVTIVLYVYVLVSKENNLVINEIYFANNKGNDWVEIYNPTMSNLSLKGFYLSDSIDDYKKFKFNDDLIIPSHGFLTVYGKSNNEIDSSFSKSLVLNFNVKNGETIYLVRDDDKIIDSMTVVESELNVYSLGRFPDGSKETFLMTQITPSTANIKTLEENID